MTKIFEVLRRPLMTEKGQTMRERDVQVFEVATWANKHQIKEAAELLLQAKVVSVRTVRVPGKTKRLGRWLGKRSDSKKAYIQLAAGSTPSHE